MPRRWLNRIIMVLLGSLSLLMIFEACGGHHFSAALVLRPDFVRFIVGLTSGFGIRMVVALLGVAGGALLIHTNVLLYWTPH